MSEINQEEPNLDCCATLHVDKYMEDFVGKRLPSQFDSEMSRIQTATLNCVTTLTSAWLCLLEDGLEEHTDIQVPTVEVVALIQCTICLIGNASEFISQICDFKIVELSILSGPSMHRENFHVQRACALVKISSPPSWLRWRKTVYLLRP